MRALYEAMRSRFLVGGRQDTSSASGATGAAWSAICRSGTTAAPRRRSARSRSSTSGSDSVVVCGAQRAHRPSGTAVYIPYPTLSRPAVSGLHASRHWERSSGSASHTICHAGMALRLELGTSRWGCCASCMFLPPVRQFTCSRMHSCARHTPEARAPRGRSAGRASQPVPARPQRDACWPHGTADPSKGVPAAR